MKKELLYQTTMFLFACFLSVSLISCEKDEDANSDALNDQGQTEKTTKRIVKSTFKLNQKWTSFNLNQSGTTKYTYDNEGRLISWGRESYYPGSPVMPSDTVFYTYDGSPLHGFHITDGYVNGCTFDADGYITYGRSYTIEWNNGDLVKLREKRNAGTSNEYVREYSIEYSNIPWPENFFFHKSWIGGITEIFYDPLSSYGIFGKAPKFLPKSQIPKSVYKDGTIKEDKQQETFSYRVDDTGTLTGFDYKYDTDVYSVELEWGEIPKFTGKITTK